MQRVAESVCADALPTGRTGRRRRDMEAADSKSHHSGSVQHLELLPVAEQDFKSKFNAKSAITI